MKLLYCMPSFLLAVCLSFNCSARDPTQLPSAPINPTADDCTNLSHAYYAEKKQLYNELQHCMFDQPLLFGVGRFASSCGPGMTAYLHCDYLDGAMCELSKRMDFETDRCTTRARIRAKRDNEERAPEQWRRYEAALRQGTQAVHRTQSLIEAVVDPKAFVFTALAKKAQLTQNETYKNALGKLFPSSVGLAGPDRSDLAQDVYRHAWQFAHDNAGAGHSDIVGTIQQAALDAIDAEYKSILGQLHEAIKDLNRLDATYENASRSGPRTTTAEPVGGIE